MGAVNPEESKHLPTHVAACAERYRTLFRGLEEVRDDVRQAKRAGFRFLLVIIVKLLAVLAVLIGMFWQQIHPADAQMIWGERGAFRNPMRGRSDMLDVKQFRGLVVRPVLERLGLYSDAAEVLLVGTAIQESRLTYLRQVGGGPALGIYQVEPATHADLYENFLRYREELRDRVRGFASLDVPAGDIEAQLERELIGNLYYATAVARAIYFRRPEPLPEAADLPALAAYWKQHYNTPLGAGTADEWLANFRAYTM